MSKEIDAIMIFRENFDKEMDKMIESYKKLAKKAEETNRSNPTALEVSKNFWESKISTLEFVKAMARTTESKMIADCLEKDMNAIHKVLNT